jgi:hypothetical protein
LYATDYRWFKYHIGDLLRDYSGHMITQRVQWEENNEPVDPAQWGIECYESEHRPGLCTEKGKIYTGSNSGYAAVNVAYHLLGGPGRIILIGFDMSRQGEQRHFFGDHPGKLNQESNYQTFMNSFATIKPRDYGLEIWNCSRRTAMLHFPRYDLDECLAQLS